jgi:hypothetical protein
MWDVLKGMVWTILAIGFCFGGGLLIGKAFAGPLEESRYCGAPKRGENGLIVRRADVRAAFRNLYACPVTGDTKGACPGWSVDHVIPLASCGCDAVSNMQWLPNEIKSGAGPLPKDRWERRVYLCKE